MARILLMLIVCLIVSLPAAAEGKPVTLTLPQALLLAARENVRVITANERVSRALARLSAERSTLYPQVSAKATQSRQTRDLRSSGISFSGDPFVGPFNSFDARVQVVQHIFDMAAIERLKAAGHSQKLSLAELSQARQETLVLVAHLFIDAKRAQQHLTAARSALVREQKRYQKIVVQKKAGTATSLEASQADASYRRSLSYWKSANTDARNKLRDLTAAVGMDDSVNIVLGGYAEVLTQPLTLPEELKIAVDGHPDVRVAREELESRKGDEAVERAGYLPKISGLADYGPSGVDPGDANATYTLGVQASLPIFEGGLRQARVREAQSLTRQSEAELNDTRRQTKSDILSARATWQDTLDVIAEKSSFLASSQEALHIAAGRYGNGVASELEYMEAAADHAAAADQFQDALAAWVLAKCQMAKTLGQIDMLLETNQQKRSVP